MARWKGSGSSSPTIAPSRRSWVGVILFSSALAQGAPGSSAPGETPPAPRASPQAARSEVSLDRLLAHADQHSPVLEVARSTRSRAEAARVAASVLLAANPTLSFAVGPRLGSAGAGLDVEAS